MCAIFVNYSANQAALAVEVYHISKCNTVKINMSFISGPNGSEEFDFDIVAYPSLPNNLSVANIHQEQPLDQ